MEGRSSSSSPPSIFQGVAPFVAKTYHMVCDPRTDGLIRWGKQDNSFLILDPAKLSQLLLPAYFKHNNFSSFIRQLNTYGFRKVDTDKWEFAHESFLRGQKHLLPLILRRKKKAEISDGGRGCTGLKKGATAMELQDEGMLVKELGRLREKQKVLEDEIQGITKRLRDTERGPNQMMLFLSKLVDDPDLLVRQLTEAKKRRLTSSCPPSSPPAQPLQVNSSMAFFNTPVELLGLNQGYAFPVIFPDHACGSSAHSGEINRASGGEVGVAGVDHQVLGSQALHFPELELAAAAATMSSSNSKNHVFLSSF